MDTFGQKRSKNGSLPEESLLRKDLGLFPVFLYDSAGCRFMSWDGFTFPLLIAFAEERPSRSTLRHEMIHYCQYRELLLVPFMLLYVAWHAAAFIVFAVKRLLWGFTVARPTPPQVTLSPWDRVCQMFNEANFYAYVTNPFEQEAFCNEGKRGYLDSRPLFAWAAYLPVFGSKAHTELSFD